MDLRRSIRQVGLTGFGWLPRPARRHAVRLGTPSFTVGGVLVATDATGRVLLVRQRHYRDGLSLPGGLLRRGEAPAEALRRELVEEIGIRTDVTRPAAALVDPLRRRVDLVFQAAFVGDPAALRPDGEEVTEVCWRAPLDSAEVGPATLSVLNELALATRGTAGSAWPAAGPECLDGGRV